MFTWQDITVALLIAAAAVYLLWRWLRRRRGSACGSCEGCDAVPSAHERQLVQLTPPSRGESPGDGR